MSHRQAFAALAALLALLSGASALASDPSARGLLRFSLIENNFSQEDAFLVLREAYRRLDMTIEADPLPAERALRTSEAGATDGEVARSEGLEQSYPHLVRVPEPLVTTRIMAVTTGLAFPVDGWESLRPYTVCFIHGIKALERITAGKRRLPTTGVGHSLDLLGQGACDVAVLDERFWRFMVSAHTAAVRELDPPLAVIPLYHYLNRRHEDLVPRVAQELRRMRAEGVTQAILKPGEDAVRTARARLSRP